MTLPILFSSKRSIHAVIVMVVALCLLAPVTAASNASSMWVFTGSMNIARGDHIAVLLPNNMVLVAGGSDGAGGPSLASSEIYNPQTGRWATNASMNSARQGHTATLLANGKVLVAGGCGVDCQTIASAELYDPGTGRWTPTGSLNVARAYHTATLLPNGKVLVVGGCGASQCDIVNASAELYDPGTGRWTLTGSLHRERSSHTATLLANGQVLVAGGHYLSKASPSSAYPALLASAERYDPVTGMWTSTGFLNQARANHTATLLGNGNVLVTGGCGDQYSCLIGRATSELYNATTGMWTLTGSLHVARQYHQATLLGNGRVLVTGGASNSHSLASAELYDSSTGQWTSIAPLHIARSSHTATLLTNGQILVAGGFDNIFRAFVTNTAELSTPL